MRTRKFGLHLGLHRALALIGSIALLAFSTSAGAQTEKAIYHFLIGGGGLEPNGGLIFDAAGNLYGTTRAGGGTCADSFNGCGVVFELSPGSDTWTETVLHNFAGKYGEFPSSGVVFDGAGNLYGTTSGGGVYNAGTVFELSPTSTGWSETVLYSFSGATDGGIPSSGVVLDSAGNVYGTASTGGANNQGVLFQLVPGASSWTENVLLNFDYKAGTGWSPLAIDASGNLYGTASNGQADHNYHRGTVYELSPSGGGWTTNIIYAFQTVYPIGITPVNGVAMDGSGNLYGMTAGVVLNLGAGEIYELHTPSWTGSNLGTLQWGIFGGVRNEPSGPVTLDAFGNLYGAVSNQDSGYIQTYDGLVFRIGPSGNAKYTFPSLLPADRFYPVGGLAIDAAGNAYGVTFPTGGGVVGTVFEITF
jgi:uncharacterized repeat protein (TIGR03803 family)